MITVDAEDVLAASKALAGNIIETPTLLSPTLSEQFNCQLYFKHEQLQYTSSFKARGAFMALDTLDEKTRKRGVIAMSAGNHAQALAFRARNMEVRATIVMPEQTPFSKVERTRSYGAEIVLTGRDLNECESSVNALIDAHGYTLIHPYDNPHVVAGQGTAGLEMLRSVPDLDMLVVPIGGGGLIAGMALIAKSIKPEIQIIGVEAELYPSVSQSMAGQPVICGGETIAEGIAVKSPGRITLPIIEELVDDIILVGEQQLEWAVGTLAEQQRVIAEGAGAASLAAIANTPNRFKGKKIGGIICGGNIDMRLLGTILNRNMMSDGRLIRLRIGISDEPGMLAKIAAAIAYCGGNIVEIYHQRMFYDVPAKLAKIDAVVDTRGQAHANEIITALHNKKFRVDVIEEPS
jgi:threonine dehydratase